MPKGYLTVTQAAKILGVTPQRVRDLIHANRLPAEELGNILIIKEADLDLVKERKPGRPKKINQ